MVSPDKQKVNLYVSAGNIYSPNLASFASLRESWFIRAGKESVFIQPIDCSGDATFHQGLTKIEQKSKLASRET